MSVYVVKLSKEMLNSIPQDERCFFFVMAHLANEINALNKLLLWSSQYPTRNDAESNGQVSLTFMSLKLLAGKLKEGQELLQKRFYGTSISRDYVPTLSEDGQKALNKIKQYFGHSNDVTYIRNNFAFHYSPEKIDAALETVQEHLEIYVSDDGIGNNLFYFAEVLAGRALLNGIKSPDDQTAYNKLIGSLPAVAGWFGIASETLMVEFLKRYDEDIWEGVAEKVQFDELPSLLDINLPWFTDLSNVA